MFGPGAKISRVNLGPLLPERLFDRLSPEKALASMKRQIERSIRLKIREEGRLSPSAKARLAKGFSVQIGERSITILAKDPVFRSLIEGQKRRQMTWLLKSGSPIPIELPTGEVIFRNATARSMKNGSWYHPGRESTGIIDAAKEEIRETMRKKVRDLLQKQLRAAMRGR